MITSRCENDQPLYGRFLTLQKLDDSAISIAEIDIKIKPPIKARLREIPIPTPGFGTMVKYMCPSPVEELYDDTLGDFIGSIPTSECQWNGTWEVLFNGFQSFVVLINNLRINYFFSLINLFQVGPRTGND